LTKHELAEVDYKAGMTYKELAEKYSVSENTIGSWKRKYNWTRPLRPHL
jgi:phage terminase small subunit